MDYAEIENTMEARTAPPNQYRLLLAGRDENRGLYHVEDYDRATTNHIDKISKAHN